ncbi:tetratricopeptide repeat protein [Parapedobacter lycopersici]|uniref:tetratricopeptide repeat protein n=1 Tax=Parapedobacter lycopersici TaxID=1864939 RepID=UPI00214DBF77|nr:tetratricopeptide repeat protein [Parapedobacter lycopersici]
MKKLATFTCVSMICLSATGQTPVDSLKNELASLSSADTTRVTLLLNIADALVWNDPQEALTYVKQAARLTDDLRWQKGKAYALRQEGVIYYEQSDPIRAMDRFHEALKAAEPLQDRSFEASIYNNIANIYSDLKQYDMALDHYRRLLAVSEALRDTTRIIIATVNMASVYIEQQQLSMGIASLNQALPLAQYIKNKRFEMAIQNNLGRALSKQGDDELALGHFNSCLQLAEQLGSDGIKANVLNSIAEIMFNRHQYAQAEDRSKEALALAEKVAALEWQANAWQTLSNIHERQHRPGEALHAYKQFITLRDSAVNDGKKAEITRKEMQFALEKQEAAAVAEMIRQRSITYAVIGVALVIMGAFAIGWRLYKRKRDSDELKKIAEFEALVADTEMKALRAQLNPHFIFNALNAIGNSIAEQDFDAAGSYLTRFAKLIRQILENSEHKEIPLTTDLELLTGYIQLESMRLQGKFTYGVDVAADIDPENTLVPPLILQPLIENSIWHGILPKKGPGHIQIRVQKEEESLCYTVEDNGIGRANVNGRSTTAKRSMGIALTKARVSIAGTHQNKPSAILFDDLPDGLAVTVKLPLSLQF